MNIVISVGDITQSNVDAIVNAANTDLKLGSGVAGAIRRGGGPTIQAECDEQAPISLGEVAATTAGNLPHKCVIHAATMTLEEVRTSAEIVFNCVQNSLEMAERLKIKRIAIPALGTGVAGLSMEDCAWASLQAVRHYQGHLQSVKEVHFILFDQEAKETFLATATQINHM